MITLSLFTSFSKTLACPTCRDAFIYGGKDAAGWAIMFMLLIVVPMLATIAFFIIRIAKRQQLHADSKYDDPFLKDNNSNK